MFQPAEPLPARGRLLLYGGEDLPGAAGRLGLTGTHDVVTLAHPDAPQLRATETLAVELAAALPVLDALPLRDPVPWRPQVSDALRCWALAARLARRALDAHRFAPTLVGGDGGLHGVWRVLLHGDPHLHAAVTQLAAALPRTAHALPRGAEAVWAPQSLLAAFLDAVVDHAARSAGMAPRPGRPRERLLPWTARWVEALTDPADPSVPLRDDPAELLAAVAGWHGLAEGGAVAGAAELQLLPPDAEDGQWVIVLGVRDESGSHHAAADIWEVQDAEGQALQDALLAGLGRAARLFPPLERVLAEPAPERVDLDGPDVWTFLAESAPLLEEAGLAVALPPGLTADELRVRLLVGEDQEDVEEGEELALTEAETAFDWEVRLGDEVLTHDELAAIAAGGSPLVRRGERWLRVDPERARRLIELPKGGTVGFGQALALGLSGSALLSDVPALAGPQVAAVRDEVEVVPRGRVQALLDRLRGASELPPVVAAPRGFVGELRPYQRRGVSWLDAMGRLGVGGVLADDMGLGKTIQLIGYLLAREQQTATTGPWLVVCPTSVVGNWAREVSRFAPELPVTRHHGTERPLSLEGVDGVVITSYGTLRRDVDLLAAVSWDVVALDEAQHVKNPETAGAKAVRRLRSRHTVALTGTPLENRLSELWALLDATNPGLLGTRSAFARRFAAPIEQRHDRGTARRLRRLVAPFVLRREKSDPAVIADLPPKIERTLACALTPEQAALYESAVERAFGAGDGSVTATSGITRRGRVLALLTELKQICNHPAQHQREDGPLPGRSGKLAAARELIHEAVHGGDQVLVFTQYVQMGHLLTRQFAEDLGTPVPFLHGSVPAGKRDDLVASFQGEGDERPPPVLVVSLRAGGTGLNLTAATHVVHYDRWWNPAVEDQATDRTHRIGQHRTVEVHKLVTAGTVEERIAELLERKRGLADQIVGAGEGWIAELGDAELRDLVELSTGATADIEDDPEGWEPEAALIGQGDDDDLG